MIKNDTLAPDAPTKYEATTITSKSVTLAWNFPMDNIGIKGFRLYRDGTLIFSTAQAGSYRDITLSPSTSYNFTLIAFDMADNESEPLTIEVTTLPLQNYNLTVVNGIGSGNYEEGSKISIQANDRTAEGYTFSQWIGDNQNLSSAWSSSATANIWGNTKVTAIYRKTAGDDMEAPQTPPNFKAVEVNDKSVKLAWETPYDDAGIYYYSLYFENGTAIDSWIQDTSFTVTGLYPETYYGFKLKAADLAGNSSEYATTNITTLTSSISFVNNNKHLFFPNPAGEMVTIGIDNLIKAELYTISGQKMQEFNQKYINVSGYSNGIYILKIVNSEGECQIEKLVIER